MHTRGTHISCGHVPCRGCTLADSSRSVSAAPRILVNLVRSTAVPWRSGWKCAFKTCPEDRGMTRARRRGARVRGVSDARKKGRGGMRRALLGVESDAGGRQGERRGGVVGASERPGPGCESEEGKTARGRDLSQGTHTARIFLFFVIFKVRHTVTLAASARGNGAKVGR